MCRRSRNRDRSHDAHLRKSYGISLEDYRKILDSQGGSCWICRGGTSKRFLAVDHCHKTGDVRGLLCARCNGVLADFRDNPEWFQRAIEYLALKPAQRILT